MENYLREIVDYGVLGLLGLMSVVSLGIVFERLFFYASLRPEVLQLYKHKNHLELELSRNLTLLSTIASNAPYVGLLGTVFGIMLTFVDIGSKGGASDAQTIMVGLALALKATAFGLLVAIPSLFCYNLLLRKGEVIVIRWENHHES